MNRSAVITRAERLLGQVDVRCVLIEAGECSFPFGSFPLMLGLAAELDSCLFRDAGLGFRASGSNRLKKAGCGSQEESRHNPCNGGERAAVPLDQFFQEIDIARGTCQHRLICKVKLQVLGESSGRRIASSPFLVECLHHYPIQIPTDHLNQPWSSCASATGNLSKLCCKQLRELG